jgi:hypothetical protein
MGLITMAAAVNLAAGTGTLLRFCPTLGRPKTDLRQRPVKAASLAAKRGRAMRASLCRMAPVRPHGDKQVTLSEILIAS